MSQAHVSMEELVVHTVSIPTLVIAHLVILVEIVKLVSYLDRKISNLSSFFR